MFIQDKRGAFEFFASKLAPTEMLSRLQSLIGGCRANRRLHRPEPHDPAVSQHLRHPAVALGEDARPLNGRSELAREEPENAVFIQDKRGAFEFFASKLAPTEMLSRLQSLIGGCRADRRLHRPEPHDPAVSQHLRHPAVALGEDARPLNGRSELAREEPENAVFIQDKRGAFEFFASKLAPTEMLSRLQSLIGGCRADRRLHRPEPHDPAVSQHLRHPAVALGEDARPLNGRSELAREEPENAVFIQDKRGAFEFFASKLAPTEMLSLAPGIGASAMVAGA